MSIGFAGLAATEEFHILQFLVDVLDKADWSPKAVTKDLLRASNHTLGRILNYTGHSFVLGVADACDARLALISNLHYFDAYGVLCRRSTVSRSFHYSETAKDAVLRIGSGAHSLGDQRFTSSMLDRYTARDCYDGGYYARCWLAGLHREAASRDETVSTSSAVYSLYANGSMSELHGYPDGSYLPLRYSGGTNFRMAQAMLGVKIKPGQQDASNYAFQGGGSVEPIPGSRILPTKLFGMVAMQLYPRHVELMRRRVS